MPGETVDVVSSESTRPADAVSPGYTSYSSTENRLEDDRSDQLLGAAAALLAQRGDEQAVALLLDVQDLAFARTDEILQAAHVDETNWHHDDEHSYVALLDVDEHLVDRFTPAVRSRIADALTYVGRRRRAALTDGGGWWLNDLRYVEARPAVPVVDGDWRTVLTGQLGQRRPDNQARAERLRASNPVEDGLAFASTAELTVYRALKELQATTAEDRTFAILPLPGARLRSGNTWTPDFLVVGGGRAFVLEIDGPQHAAPHRHVFDRDRDLQWNRCNIHVARITVEDADDSKLLRARLVEEIRRNLYPGPARP